MEITKYTNQPDEIKTIMWTGENHREMFDFLTNGEKHDDYMTASGENFLIDHNTVKGGLILKSNIGGVQGCRIPVKIGDYIIKRRYGDKWHFSAADGEYFESTHTGNPKKPIEVFEDQEQLEKCLREWQHRLFLDGWMILAHTTDEITDPDGNRQVDVEGYNTFIYESSQASIQILTKKAHDDADMLFKYCAEKILVHELLHCKYVWMDNQNSYEGVYVCSKEHQLLEEMAKSLIMAKYGVDYSYFM